MSNLVSLVVFAWMGQVLWGLVGFLMGAFQTLGARLGSRLALTRGTPFIRAVFLAVVSATLARVLWTAFS